MQFCYRSACFAVLFCFSAARGERAHPLGPGPVTDVGPEAGAFFGIHGFIFGGRDEVLVASARAGIYRTLDGGQHWVRSESGLVTSDGVEPYAFDLCQSPSVPEVAYVMTLQDGLSRTSDFGESYGPLVPAPNLFLSDCSVDPLDPDVVYTLSGSDPFAPAILSKSTDGGRTFFNVGLGLEAADPQSLAVAPTNAQIVYVVGQTALYVSSDAGLNFQRLPNAPASPLLVYPHPTQDGTLFVVTAHELFLSSDGGESFVIVGGGLPPIWLLAFGSSDPTEVYAAGSTAGIFRSADGGVTFERVHGLGEAELVGLGAVGVGVGPGDAQNPPVVYAATSLGPFRSDDAGETFIPTHTGYRATQVQDLAVDAANRLLVATINSVGLFRSSELGTYEVLSNALPNSFAVGLQGVAGPSDNADAYVVVGNYRDTATGSIFTTSDSGRSWHEAALSASFYATRARIAFAPSDSNRIYVALSPGGLLRSDDAGQSFDQLSTRTMGAVAVHPGDPDTVYVGCWASSSCLYKSTDGGQHLQLLNTTGNVSAIVLDPGNAEVVYVGLRSGRIIRSLDGGQTFAPADSGVTGDQILGLAMDPVNPARLFAWTLAGGLFRTEDGAGSWTLVDAGETLRRSTAQVGQTALVIRPGDPTQVYMGNGSVLQFVEL